MTEQTPENPNDPTPPAPPVPPVPDAEGAAPEQAGSHELPGAAPQASFEPTPAFHPAPAYTPEPAAESEQVAAPEQADAAPAHPADPALGGHGLPTGDPAAPAAPAYGAPEQPQTYGAPEQPQYGAPAQPQAPYGAPAQPAFGAAPQDPYAAAPQNPYGAPAPQVGDPAAPTAPYGAAPSGYPQPDQATTPYGAAPYGDPSQSGGFPPASQPGQPGQPGQPEKKKLSTGALIAIIGGALAVVLIIAAVIIIPLANRGGGSPSGDGDDDTVAPSASSPEEFVEGYLTALADGDAKAALEYVDISYYDKGLLTDEVLEASLELGAIDDIKTGKVTKNEYENSVVPVTFTVGGEEVEREFEVSESYDGELSMYDGLIRVSPYGFEEMGLTINGAEVPDDAAVFPGTYEFAVSVENFGIEGGESTFTLIDEDDADELYNLAPALTEEGLATFRSMVDASLRECLASKSLSTPCGMNIAANDGKGVTSIDGTVTRTLTAEGESALKTLEPRITENTVVTGSAYLSIDITFEGEKDGQRGMYEVLFGNDLKTPKVDFAADEPVVVWE